jgi:hypothetical protein
MNYELGTWPVTYLPESPDFCNENGKMLQKLLVTKTHFPELGRNCPVLGFSFVSYNMHNGWLLAPKQLLQL